jgi:hypothetical protein
MKTGFKLLIGCLALALPLGGFAIASAAQKPVYSESFVAELPAKYQRLATTSGKKIVFAAASSLAFSLRSDIVEQELPEYKSVNMGLYVTLKSKATLELCINNLKEGDLLVYAPEPLPDLYTSEFAKEPLLQATETDRSLFKNYSESDLENLVAASFSFNLKRMKANADGVTYTSKDPYNRGAFNDYGEIKVATPYNEMTLGYDPSVTVDYSTNLLNASFLHYLASVKSRAEQKKARFFYSFSPCNALAYQASAENVAAFQSALTSALGDCLLTSIPDTVYEAGYFYDTNFHTNDAGKIKHTVTLINALKAKLKITTPTATIVPNPSGSNPNIKPYDGDNTFEPAFTYRTLQSKLLISEVDSSYLGAQYFLLPSSHEGAPIVGIAADAFKGCDSLRVIRIPKNYKVLMTNSLADLPSIERIEIYNDDPNTIAPPTSGPSALLASSNPAVKIYVPKAVLADYQTHYFWGAYAAYLEGM